MEWLALVPLVKEDQAKELRLEVHKKLVAKAKLLSPDETKQLAQQFTKLLPAAVHTPAEAAEILGKNKKVSRQLLHRHWLEQWHYEQPLPLVLTFDHPKGMPPRLISVRAGKVTPW